MGVLLYTLKDSNKRLLGYSYQFSVSWRCAPTDDALVSGNHDALVAETTQRCAINDGTWSSTTVFTVTHVYFMSFTVQVNAQN